MTIVCLSANRVCRETEKLTHRRDRVSSQPAFDLLTTPLHIDQPGTMQFLQVV